MSADATVCCSGEIEAVLNYVDGTTDLSRWEHRRLFELFVKIEEHLLASKRELADLNTATPADTMIELQSTIMRAATERTANTVSDVLFKLALWRWDSVELDKTWGDMRRADHVAFSAFNDLATIAGDSSVVPGPAIKD